MLDTIREQEREIQFCHEAMKFIFRSSELQKIKGRSKYDDNRNQWVIPPFYVKEKEVLLPRINRGNVQALIDSE